MSSIIENSIGKRMRWSWRNSNLKNMKTNDCYNNEDQFKNIFSPAKVQDDGAGVIKASPDIGLLDADTKSTIDVLKGRSSLGISLLLNLLEEEPLDLYTDPDE
jgi:hypothetical protein